MLWLPESTTEAAWMQRPLPNGGFKWWIAALGDQLVTQWGENGLLKQSKIIDNSPITSRDKFREKIEEKFGKGYSAFARYNPSTGWTANEPQIQVPPYPPRPRGTGKRHTEGLILHVRLFDGADFYLDLKLIGITGHNVGTGTCGPYRLDHLESVRKPPGGMDFPLWQTRFERADEAMAVIKGMVANKEDKGFSVLKLTGSTHLTDFLQGRPLETPKPTLQLVIDDGSAPVIWFW